MPSLTARVMIRFLKDIGFELKRQRGSHKFFAHPDGRSATVPDHRGESLGRGIVSKILRDVEISRETFTEWMKG